MSTSTTVTLHLLDKEYRVSCSENERAGLESSARFLDAIFADSYTVQTNNANQFQRIVTITVTLNNIDISVLSADVLELGTYETTISF